MKQLFLILILVTISNVVRGETYPTVSIQGRSAFILQLNDWQKEELLIKIYDQDGRVMHSEKLENGSSLRKYNLEKLPIGQYHMVVADQLKDITFDLEISSDGIQKAENAVVFFRPFIQIEDDKVDINYLTINKSVKLELINKNGKVLYKDTTPALKKYERRLDVSQLPAGTYTLYISSGSRSYSQDFSK